MIEVLVGPVLSRLVIGDAQHGQFAVPLDEIDRSPQNEAAVDEDGIRQAARIAPVVVQAEAELEVLRNPVAAVGEAPNPDGEVAADLVDLVAPDAFDRRRQLVGVLARHAVDDRVQRRDRLRQRAGRHRQPRPRRRARDRTPPARDGTGCRASADRAARAARAPPTARADGSSRAGTGTDTSRSAAARTASRAAGPGAGGRARARSRAPRGSGRRSATSAACRAPSG